MQDRPIVGDFFRNKWVRLILVLDIVAIIAIVAVAIVNSLRTAVIEFNVTPVNSVISVNGDSSYSNGSYRFFPGTYEITVSREGLDPKTFILELGNNDIQTVALFLSNNGNFDFYELKENYSSFAKLAEIASAANNLTIDHDTSAEKFIEEFNRKTSIDQILPLEYQFVDDTNYGANSFFAINENPNCIYNGLCLIVSPIINASEDQILEFIRTNGYNPNDYQITFKEDL